MFIRLINTFQSKEFSYSVLVQSLTMILSGTAIVLTSFFLVRLPTSGMLSNSWSVTTDKLTLFQVSKLLLNLSSNATDSEVESLTDDTGSDSASRSLPTIMGPTRTKAVQRNSSS